MAYKLIAPLHGYQKQAARHVLQGKGNALFLEMGLGKTLTTLETLNHRKVNGKTNRVLIIAPRRICESVWRQEALAWKYPLSVNFLSGTPAKRLAALTTPQADVYLMTYENLIWLEKSGVFPFDTVVLDELSKMKNSGSKRWKAFKRLIKKHRPWVLGLTGTPAPNGYDDLWAQMYCLDQGKTLGPVKGKFLQTYFSNISRDPTRYAKWILKPGAKAQIDQRLKSAGVVAMTARQVLNQQPPTRLPTLQVGLPSSCAGIYEELEQELMATMPGGKVILPEHDATIQLKLRQLSSGFMIDEDKNVHRLHTGKLDALQDYVEEMDGEPLMVIYTFQEELKMILERFPDTPYLGGGVNERDADKAISAWNRGELPLLLVQPASGGHGLNLQLGGHHMLFYSVDWNLETYQQVVARLNRQGQPSPVVFVRHMAAGDVEDNIMDTLAEKAGVQAGLMDVLENATCQK